MKILDEGLNAPKGYISSGIFAGLKKKNRDMALIVSRQPASAAGAFTQNIVRAAPVEWDVEIIKSEKPVQAILINSGNANACTGKQGEVDTHAMAQRTAETLGYGHIGKDKVLVCSTGVIGVPLPMKEVHNGILEAVSHLGSSREHARQAAEAILTTDTFTKEIAVEIEIGGKPVRIAGIAKGSGMIHPNMATMLSFIITDACIHAPLLQKLLGESIQDSYNMISVDGDTSTNDTALALANGASDAPQIEEGSEDFNTFRKAFDYVNAYLAKQIVLDGEGASKFIEAWVQGAASKEDARLIVKSVITSNLVKTAFFGEDANWGRILCAMGYSGAQFDPKKTNLDISSASGSIRLLEAGTPVAFDESRAAEVLAEKALNISIELQDGDASATAWGCDLSYEYVKINGEYRT